VISVTPRSLESALNALASSPGLLPIAGCTDIMVAAPERRPGQSGVLNVQEIPELRGIGSSETGLDIGAAVTFDELRQSPDVQRVCPILAEAAAVVGGWQIQNRATIGGNIANASPAGDSLPALLALNASVVVAGAGGTREIPYDDFHVAYRRTALAAGELIVRVRVPAQPHGTVQRFRKVGTREAQAISKVVVALCAQVAGGTITGLRLAAGSVAPVPVRLRQAEQAALERPLGDSALDRIAEAAAGEVRPIDDVRSTAAYRAFALRQVVRRMLASL
jgi:CO/xanthine dehydrogenase FAD-binding subunit